MARVNHGTRHQEEVILTKALKNAAEYWGMNNRQLGGIIGLSEATISRLRNDHYLLEHDSKPWQLAVVFLRVFRGLDAYMGGNAENERLWLQSNNTALGGIPADLMHNIEGLASVVQYVDYMRGQ